MGDTAARSGATCAFAIMLASLSPAATAAAPPGPYIGIGAGIYTLDVDDADFDFDDEAGLVRGFGGLRLGPYWAVEADYQRLAEVSDRVPEEVELDVDAWTLSLRPILPVGEVVDLYARAGWTWYDAEATVAAELFDTSLGLDGSGNDFTWGGGVDVHLGDTLTLRGDLSRIEIEDTELDIVSASIMLRF